MKRVLLIVVMGFAFMQLANAQVIELIGQGVVGVNPSTLLIPDNGPVEKVVVVASALFSGSTPAVPAEVTFSDADETYTVNFTETNPNKLPSFIGDNPNLAFGYYTATFNTVDVSGITMENYGQEAYLISFTAYVYRSGDTPGIFSDVKGPNACMYLNGADDPVEYSFTIPSSVSPRDVVVTLPFSHLYDVNGLPANVKVTAGDKFVEAELWTNNRGNYLRLETLTIEDVGGDVTEVVVSIFSQKKDEFVVGVNGANFITGPGLVTTTYALEVLQACTHTPVYWKNHSKYGPEPYDANWAKLSLGSDTEFFLSGQSYHMVLMTPPEIHLYYILAHQYIAAELNILAGASDAEVSSAMAAAKSLLNTYTPEQVEAMRTYSTVKNMLYYLAVTLGKYNYGEIGPGICDEEEMEQEEVVATLDVKINPNPIRYNARIEFVPVFDGRATVDLFDLRGYKKAILFNQNVLKGNPVHIGFNTWRCQRGSYVLVFTNGTLKESHKIYISK